MHHRAGTDWVVETIAEAVSPDGKKLPIRVHKSGPEGALIGPLQARGVEVVEVSSAEAAQATGQLIDAARSGLLVHLGQPSLNKALRGAEVRMSSDGSLVWSQRNSKVEITPLMACTVALSGVAVPAGFAGNPFTSLDDWEDDE
jgi:phage terminase large subunit-like protein